MRPGIAVPDLKILFLHAADALSDKKLTFRTGI